VLSFFADEDTFFAAFRNPAFNQLQSELRQKFLHVGQGIADGIKQSEDFVFMEYEFPAAEIGFYFVREMKGSADPK
jgi:hypothetical protein